MSKNRIKHTVSNSKARLSLKHCWRREGIPKGQVKRDKAFHPHLLSLSLISILAPLLSPKICAQKTLNTHGQPCLTDCVLGLQALEVDLTKCISQTRALELPGAPWLVELMKLGCVCVCVCVCVLVAQSCRTLCDPMDCSLLLCPWGFSRQEYWSGLPCPPPGDLPNPESPAVWADSLPSEPSGKPRILEWVAYPFPSFSSWSRN